MDLSKEINGLIESTIELIDGVKKHHPQDEEKYITFNFSNYPSVQEPFLQEYAEIIGVNYETLKSWNTFNFNLALCAARNLLEKRKIK